MSLLDGYNEKAPTPKRSLLDGYSEPLRGEVSFIDNAKQFGKGALKGAENTIVSDIRGILDPTFKGNMFHDMIVEPIQRHLNHEQAPTKEEYINQQKAQGQQFIDSFKTPEGLGENVGSLITNAAILGGAGKFAKVPKIEEVPVETVNAPNGTQINTGLTYIDESPLKINTNQPIKKIGEDIRYEHQGDMNANILRGVHIGEEVGNLLKDKNQDIGLYLKRDILTQPNGQELLQGLVEKYPHLKEAAYNALNPTPEMLKAETIVNNYYGATGKAGKNFGYMDNLLDEESYSNRVFKKNERPQTEVFKQGLPKSTGHAKQRVFNTVAERALTMDEEPLTWKQSDLIKIHAEENPKVLATHKLYQSLENEGIAIKAKKQPSGYTSIGKEYYVPNELYTHIKSIIESSKLNSVSLYNGIRKVNGVLKANLLGGLGSGFHFLNVTKNLVNSHLSIGDFIKYGFDKESRVAYARSGGILTTFDAGKDVLAELTKDNRPLVQVTTALFNNPATKALNKKLFEEYIPAAQTALWKKNMTEWALKHPDATEAQIKQAARSFADHSNNMGGFSNLTAKGMTKTTQGVLQQSLLALQWSAAKVNHLAQLLERSPGGHQARLTAFRGIVYSQILGNILNELFTGHSMWENDERHKFDINWGGDVYTSTLPPALEDVEKLNRKVEQKGIIGGPAQFILGKGSPVVHIGKAITDVADNKNYFGQHIYDRNDNPYTKTLKSAQYIGAQNMDIPIGLQNTYKLYTNNNTNPYDYILSGAGVGTVDTSKHKKIRH